MSLLLGDTAPDFEAETTEGRIRFHDWIGEDWVVFFSHPADFTPVCTTELGYTAKLKDKLAQMGSEVSEEEDDDVPTQVTSLDAIPELLQAPSGPKPNNEKPASSRRPAPSFNIKSLGKPSLKEGLKQPSTAGVSLNFAPTGKQAWQGCHEPREDLSLVELVETFLKL